jgi:methylmalonyl-CoA/ethylmalonyl-CoA epimerase
MIKNIDHIGVAVQNLDKSIKKWCDFFNLPQPQKEKMEERGVEVAALHTGKGPSVELIAPLGKNSPVGKFLKKKGEGIHHFCFLVENLEESVRELKAKGVSFIHPEPVKGAHGSRIIFIHPEIFNGVLIELKEKGSRSFDYSVY